MSDMQNPLERMDTAPSAQLVCQSGNFSLYLWWIAPFYLNSHFLINQIIEYLRSFVSQNELVKTGFNKFPGIHTKVSSRHIGGCFLSFTWEVIVRVYKRLSLESNSQDSNSRCTFHYFYSIGKLNSISLNFLSVKRCLWKEHLHKVPGKQH